jgi:hypothetical protein
VDERLVPVRREIADESPPDERRSDALRRELVHGEAQERPDVVDREIRCHRSETIDPSVDRRVAVPGHAVPADHTRRAEQPHLAAWVPLHDRSAERRLEADQVVLIRQVATEARDVGDPVAATDGEAGDAVGEPACELDVDVTDRDQIDRRPEVDGLDEQSGARREERAVGGHPSLESLGSERVGQLHECCDRIRHALERRQALLGQLVGEPLQPTWQHRQLEVVHTPNCTGDHLFVLVGLLPHLCTAEARPERRAVGQTKALANTRLTIVITLRRMFIAGPDVSLNGSPTVSPTTAALCGSEPLPP